ncbi:hypothetical protein [Burkholderia sp. Ac-20365]|uniref:hypothetical protein n=1 Tax=Burkholderia sp. Ac-20365 TaxID=2703897 RepID=UPI00197BE6A8|nr:hypothetical protein [Burkholderia sp. Ac-20365]MBN3767544.1 hypothetical protein [Burkholderia sp. Ac-20365]
MKNQQQNADASATTSKPPSVARQINKHHANASDNPNPSAAGKCKCKTKTKTKTKTVKQP